MSVIIPSYNTAQYIGEALDSVFAQSFKDYEVIVINDGSPDSLELERVLQPYSTRIRYLKKENGGLASARNAGIRVSRGELLVMFDSDDIWLPGYLEKQVAAITASPDIAVSYTNATLFGDSPLAGKDFMSLFPSEGEVTFFSMLEEKVHVMGTSMVRRNVIMEAGLYDEKLRSSEDFELWLRVAHKGWKFVYTREPLFLYRRREGCLSLDQMTFWKNLQIVMDKIERTLEMSSEERALFMQRRRHMKAMLDLHEGKEAFAKRNFPRAIESLSQANTFFSSPKLTIVLRMLQLAPQLVFSISDARDRLMYRKTKT